MVSLTFPISIQSEPFERSKRIGLYLDKELVTDILESALISTLTGQQEQTQDHFRVVDLAVKNGDDLVDKSEQGRALLLPTLILILQLLETASQLDSLDHQWREHVADTLAAITKLFPGCRQDSSLCICILTLKQVNDASQLTLLLCKLFQINIAALVAIVARATEGARVVAPILLVADHDRANLQDSVHILGRAEDGLVLQNRSDNSVGDSTASRVGLEGEEVGKVGELQESEDGGVVLDGCHEKALEISDSVLMLELGTLVVFDRLLLGESKHLVGISKVVGIATQRQVNQRDQQRSDILNRKVRAELFRTMSTSTQQLEKKVVRIKTLVVLEAFMTPIFE